MLNTNGGFNLYLGNNPSATGWFVSISETPRGPTWEDLRKTGEFHASETLKQDAIEWIKSNPTEFAILAAKKTGFFWMPPVHEGKTKQSSLEKMIRIIWLIQFLILVPGALLVLLIKSLRNREVAILMLAVICYTGVHSLFYIIFRYREPIMPIVAILAALSFEYLFTQKVTSTAEPCN